MKVLVIGGTRFFGKRLVQMLLERGDEITILTRGRSTDPFGDKVQRLQADRTKQEELREAIGNKTFHAVVDQICFNAQEAQDAVDIFKDRTDFYLMTSTMAVYQLGAGLKEEDFDPLQYAPQTPSNPAEAYAEGKRAAERILLQQMPTKAALARFPIVLGEDDYTQRLENQVQKVKQGEPLYFPNLDAHFSFIHAEDAARALTWLLTTKSTGAYNFTAPDDVKIGDLVAMMEKATGKKANLLKEPDEKAWSPFGITTDFYMNPGKARSEGFDAWKLEDWLEKLVQSYAK